MNLKSPPSSHYRENRIRTCDPYVPNVVLYQTELLPDIVIFNLIVKKSSPISDDFYYRENRIRTCDPLVPNQVLYQTELFPDNAPSRSRTYNLLIRSQTLYPVALWVHIQCRGPESNRYGDHSPQDFKSCASASSATPA